MIGVSRHTHPHSAVCCIAGMDLSLKGSGWSRQVLVPLYSELYGDTCIASGKKNSLLKLNTEQLGTVPDLACGPTPRQQRGCVCVAGVIWPFMGHFHGIRLSQTCITAFLSLLPRLNEVQEAKASNISIAAFCMLMSAFTLFPTLHQLGPAKTVNHVICSFFMAPPPLNYPNPNVCSIHTLVLLRSLPESDLIAPPSVFVCLFSPP